MAIYNISNAQLRNKVGRFKSGEYIIYDDSESGNYNEKLTLVIRDGEVAVSQGKKTWRVGMAEAVDLMRILDGHFETVRDGIIQYYEAHRAEVNK